MLKAFMRIAVIFLVLLFCNSASRAESVGFIGGLKEDQNFNGVAEVGLRGDEKWWGASGSLMWFSNEEHIYDGINISFNAGMGKDVRAYTGLGLFFGHYENEGIFCEKSSEEECQDSYVSGLYPEIGVQMSILEFRIGAYGRYYNSFDADVNENSMYGIYIGHEL